MTRIYELEALTDIWTGDADTASTKKAERLIPTGVLGSLRWWFEVLVRGLGGTACDPSADRKTCQGCDHCVVCNLFGCTGWARKFRFDVLDSKGTIQQRKIGKGARVALRFTPLRAVREDEWGLVGLTVRLIADYGALGGKTVLKPSDQNAKIQHADFGLVRCCGSIESARSRAELATYVSSWTPKKPDARDASWASCKQMWFVAGHYVTRKNDDESTFNHIIGRPEPKDDSKGGDSWLAGSRGTSKKVFSFSQPARTFGFVRNATDLETTRTALQSVWGLHAGSDWFLAGDAILDRLCATMERPR